MSKWVWPAYNMVVQRWEVVFLGFEKGYMKLG